MNLTAAEQQAQQGVERTLTLGHLFLFIAFLLLIYAYFTKDEKEQVKLGGSGVALALAFIFGKTTATFPAMITGFWTASVVGIPMYVVFGVIALAIAIGLSMKKAPGVFQVIAVGFLIAIGVSGLLNWLGASVSVISNAVILRWFA